MKPEQCRAGRKSLGWSQEAMADRATISVSAVRKFDLGPGSPRGYVPQSIRRAFIATGLVFADESAEDVGATAGPRPGHGGVLA